MYIKSVSIKNIRGFEDLYFDLAHEDGTYAGWTVFTGDNGSGKSSLLKAIAVCLTGQDTARALQPSFKGWIRDNSGNAESSVQLEIVKSVDDGAVASGNTPRVGSAFPAKIELVESGKEPRINNCTQSDKRKPSLPERTIWSQDAKGWFSCGYGPFRRVFGASPEAMRQMVAISTEKFVTMFQEAASLAEVDQWLRNLKHKQLENKSLESKQLNLLMAILQDDLMPNQISIDRVDSDGLWLRDRNGVQLSWNEMSDGYRAALALLSDIVRHLLNTFGIEGLVEETDSRPVIKSSGVVLIDEIDAHLHPEWQRKIGFWLKEHFPNIQFIVTTHSPLICQAVDKNGLFVLPEPGSADKPRPLTNDEYQSVISSKSDEILLSPAFNLKNTRSPIAVKSRARYAELKAKERAGGIFTEAENIEIKQLGIFIDNESI